MAHFVILDSEGQLPVYKEKPHFVYAVPVGTTVQFCVRFDWTVEKFCIDLKKYEASSTDLTGVVEMKVLHTKLGHMTVDVPFERAGSFKFWLTRADGTVTTDQWLVVKPLLEIAGDTLHTEQICLQTLLTRQVGEAANWLQAAEYGSSLGYNFFHITPVQELGGSQSLYSIKDQLALNSDLFSSFQQLQETITTIETTHKIGCLVDVVLNHTSFDSEWILKDTSAGYDHENCPYLRSSYHLDRVIDGFSIKIENRQLPQYSKTTIDNESDLALIIELLTKEVNAAGIVDWHLINAEETIKAFKAAGKSTASPVAIDKVELQSVGVEVYIITHGLVDEGKCSGGTTIDSAFLSALDVTAASLPALIDNVNKAQLRRVQEFLDIALANI